MFRFAHLADFCGGILDAFCDGILHEVAAKLYEICFCDLDIEDVLDQNEQRWEGGGDEECFG